MLFRALGGVRFAVLKNFSSFPAGGRFVFYGEIKTMIRKFFIFLQFLLIFSLPAASGIAADTAVPDTEAVKLPEPAMREKALMLFISALLEKNPEKQCSQLLQAVETDPENSETPLAAFQNSFKKVKKRKAVVKKFNELWKNHPVNTFLMLHGAELNRVLATPRQIRLQLLEPGLSLSPASLTARPEWDSSSTFILINNAAEILLASGKYSGLISIFRSWLQSPEPHRIQSCTILARTCYIAAARSFSRGDLKSAGELEKCFADAVTTLRKIENSVTAEKDALAVILFYSSFRQLLKDDLLRFASAYRNRIRSHRSDTLLMSAAMECGELKLFNESSNAITRRIPRFDTSEMRFKMLLNAGRFSEAEAEIKRMPQKHHFELRRQMLYKKKDWHGLYMLVSNYLAQGGAPDPAMGIILISIAEKLGDKNIFRQAKKILSPHTNIAAIANSIGYVGAVLEVDLPECRKLLTFALGKEPDNVAYLDSIAWIAYKQGNFSEAEKWINMALERITPMDGVAVIFEHAGDIAAALKKDPAPWYKASLKYAPFDSEFDKAAVIKKMKSAK